jgi:glycosyltransferase involved in cell wall biosynthesis
MIVDGLTKNFWPEIFAGAWQDSKLKTAWYGAIITLMHWIGIYRKINGWLAISQFMKSTFIRAGIPEDKIFLIRHSWDIETESLKELATSSEEISDSDPTILFLGRLTEAKGIKVLIEAWKQLEEETSEGRLIIGGDGPLKEWVIEQQGKLKRLEYVGFVSGNQKKVLFKECRAMVVPSVWWEPLGLVVYEAYEHYRPVIAARSGGLTETVVEGETGWLYPPNDIESLKTCITTAFENKAEAKRRGAAGRSWVVNQTGSDAWLEDFNKIVNKVCKETYPLKDEPKKPFTANLTDSYLSSSSSKIQNPKSKISPSLSELSGLAVQPSSSSSNIQNPTSKISPSPLGELVNLAVQPSSSSNIQNPTSKISPSLGDLVNLAVQPSSNSSSKIQHPTSKISLSIYLADQNPGHGRSFGISRMSKVILDEMAKREDLGLKVLCTLSSLKGPEKGAQNTILPWSTRSRIMRLLTDQFHPVLAWFTATPDIWYFPKGFLPRFNLLKAPTVVTVHDTIIQHHADHYPHWRKKPEYAYWARMLRHTLRHADVVLTVSEHSRAMILAFMARHNLPEREITVTYEPCCYEGFEQPHDPPKGDHVLHLASREPHKRSHDLISWWAARTRVDSSLPVLELVGNIPRESWNIVASNSCFRRRPFLDDEELRNTITQARALILPSEIEGFGLPAIEAYYLGTPVCFVKGTSVEEILGESTSAGAFELAEPDSLWEALDQVLAMPAAEVRRIGLELRERFAAAKVVDRMIEGFRSVAGTSSSK